MKLSWHYQFRLVFCQRRDWSPVDLAPALAAGRGVAPVGRTECSLRAGALITPRLASNSSGPGYKAPRPFFF